MDFVITNCELNDITDCFQQGAFKIGALVLVNVKREHIMVNLKNKIFFSLVCERK
jgi:hypothetical protein